MKRILINAACALTALSSAAQVPLVNSGKPIGRIVTEGDSINNVAATLLQDFVHRISGAKLPVVDKINKAGKGDVFIKTRHDTTLSEDGFRLHSDKGCLYVNSGGGNGAIFAIVTLLENYLGVNYYGENEYTLTENKDIVLPNIDITEIPAFRYRQSQSYALQTDPIYRMWMRLEEPSDEFASGYWVHTFDRLLPSAQYGESHPEYYSFINGQRRPGKASQWCLSNPEVFEIVAGRIDSIFKANPGKNMISVSQNDGNHTYCTCPECAAVNEEEGSPSGIYIRFLNKLASRMPDKQFSTLAYLFTMHPPKHTKPLPNVNIMLCDIDAKREVPLTDNPSGRDFVKALEGWSKISDNIFVWDYGINFDNYLAPFPNFPILQKNIQLFRNNNAKMHFSQIASSRGGDFAEMRTYMVSKLMWNPDLDADSLIHSFMDGYYGKAAPYLYEYEKLLEGGLLASGKDLWIYDSPVTHKDGMLNKNCRKRYNELFDKAEASVANDSVLLKRVRRQRLPLQYSELEIARAEGTATNETVGKLLDIFEQRTNEYNGPTLNERLNSPAEYCRIYRSRYLAPKGQNLATGAKVTWLIKPSGHYKALGEKGLTDEIYGGSTYVESWIGWEGTDGSFILDMGESKTFTDISGDFLHQLGAWIFLPKDISFSVSSDGKNFKKLGTAVQPEDRSPKVQFKKLGITTDKPVTARYLKVDITGVKTCPGWHYGVGSPGWFFLDEITVK